MNESHIEQLKTGFQFEEGFAKALEFRVLEEIPQQHSTFVKKPRSRVKIVVDVEV